ncbi:hypothetical protein Ddc_23156 [Ditylenchus destructor]|nr:hypothetical protein Ddc_23156 [Ditylenchus destructor]
MPALGELFFDVIDGGGSLGFLEDVDEPQMREYWEGVFDALGPRQRLWIAREGTRCWARCSCRSAENPTAVIAPSPRS